jgi:hypothetical protein
MPSINITAQKQGIVGVDIAPASNWNIDARNANTGSFASTYTSVTNQGSAIFARFISGRGYFTASCTRTYFRFDTSSVPGIVTSAQLSVYYGYFSFFPVDIIPIQSFAFGISGTSNLTNNDFSNINYGTNYSLQNPWSTSPGNNVFSLNADAINDINNNQFLNLALIDYVYDYQDLPMPLGTQNAAGVTFADTNNPVELQITYSAGYLNDVNGVASGSIGTVEGIATADISAVNGV